MATTRRRKATPKTKQWSGYHRILWPTDFSPLAKAALPHAVGLATQTAAELVLLHVLPLPAMYAAADLSGAVWIPLQRKTRAAAQRELRRLEAQVKAPKIRIHTVLTEGVAFQQIVRAAKRLRCDLIVMASHGRKGVQAVLLGSETQKVLTHSNIPVLVCRHQ